MNSRKRRNVVIGSLCLLLVFMGVGFAIITKSLNIKFTGRAKGNFNIYIDTFEVSSISTDAQSIKSEVESDRLSASFEANLNKPGDFVEYLVVVKNDGSIDARLDNVTFTVSGDNEYFNNTTDCETGYNLKAGENYACHVKTMFREDITEWDTDNSLIATSKLDLSFIQTTDKGGNSIENRTLLAQGDISKTGSDSVSYKYYDDGYLEITGAGKIKDFNENTTTITSISDTYNLPLISQIAAQIINTKLDVDYADMFSNGKLAGVYAYSNICFASSTGLDKYKSAYGNKTNITDISDYLVDNGNISASEKEVLLNICENIPSLKEINIPEGINSIGNDMFNGFMYDKSINFPYSITEIGSNAFKNNAITNITLQNGVTKIGSSAFENNSLIDISLPRSMTEIGSNAFKSNNLMSANVRGQYTTFNNNIFNCNANLTDTGIVFEETNKTISDINTNGFVCN